MISGVVVSDTECIENNYKSSNNDIRTVLQHFTNIKITSVEMLQMACSPICVISNTIF